MIKTEVVYNCPVCKSLRTGNSYLVKEYGKGPGLIFSECKQCMAVFLAERIVESEIGEAYKDEYEPYNDRTSILRKLFVSWRDGREVKYIKKHVADARRILEIGSSWGRYLNVLKKRLNLEAVGVEISKEAAEIGRAKHGLDIRIGTLESQNFPDSRFDIVVMNHVLEHLYRPVTTLKNVFKVMKGNAILLIRTPNTISPERKLFGKYWGPYDVPRHITLFSEPTIRKVLSECGFKDILIGYESIPNDIILSIKNFVTDLRAPGFICNFFTIKNPLAVLLFSPISMFLGLFGKSSRMVIWAKKS